MKGSNMQETALSYLDLPIQSEYPFFQVSILITQVSDYSEVACSFINIL